MCNNYKQIFKTNKVKFLCDRKNNPREHMHTIDIDSNR